MIQTSLTQAQKTTLKAAIAANTAQITVTNTDTGQQTTAAMNTLDNSGFSDNAIAAWYNQQASPAFYGNYSTVPVAQIFGAIKWKRVIPTDAPDTTQQWGNRSLACQGCQFNIQTMLFGQAVIDATQKQTVQGFQDSLDAVPSGAGGVAQDAGWATVQPILCRLGNNAEKLFADTSVANGSTNLLAATFTYEAQPNVGLTGSMVQDARNNG